MVLVPAIPLTANGKVDRVALSALDDATKQDAVPTVAPSTDTEIRLAQIWSEVLKKEGIGARDNFLELGGHSLFAIRVLGKISKTFGVRLPLRTLFESPTIAELAEIVDMEAESLRRWRRCRTKMQRSCSPQFSQHPVPMGEHRLR